MERPFHVSLVAGVAAGAVEGFITYPTEYLKTQLQIPGTRFTGPLDCLTKTVHERGILGLYKGLSPLVIGNASKAGVRFMSFDYFNSILKVEMNPSTASVIAGLGAGMTEAILVVTPSETIKTKLIHDQNRAIPQYKGLIHGIKTIVQVEGVRGIYRGLSAVIARQGANSAVRMSTYQLIRNRLARAYPLDKKGKPIVPWYTTFFSGAIAGTITVYATMPLDVVKTRLQSLGAQGSIYSNLSAVLKQDGVFALWKGATPRLGRLIFSGGIVFTIYEGVMSLYDTVNL